MASSPESDREISIPGRRVPVAAEPDVCVVGGGAAGVAAAVAAGRLGLSVLLVERYGFCGGATVAGLSGSICGLFSSGDRPEQIVFGFAGEFYDRLRAAGGAHAPVPFGRTLLVPHDSFVWKETADRLLEENGVRVLYHTVLVDAMAGDDGACRILVLLAKEGLIAVRPKCVVDASGDAEVVHRLRGATTLGDRGVVQAATMVFRLGGVDMAGFHRLDPRALEAQIAEADRQGRYRLPRHHVYLFPLPNEREVLCNMTRITFPDGSVPLGIKSADLSFAEQEGRRQARGYATFLRENVEGFANSYLVDSGAQVGIRQTRSIVGRRRLLNEEVLRAAKFPGAATFSAWPIEAHGAGALKIVYLDNQAYDIPFETLIPEAGGNVVAAGRCFSAESEALASARVTAQCFGMGYAAGAACGLMIGERLRAEELSGPQVADWMRGRGLKTASVG